MSSFFNSVYDVVAKIPRGKVATYGQIGKLLGNPRGARVVGWAMQAAPENLRLPCHRVVNRLGEMSPGDIFGGPGIQRAILEAEGIVFNSNGQIDMKKCLWHPENLEIFKE